MVVCYSETTLIS